MNERIKHLWDQASGEFCKQNPYATIMLPAPLREKFAELIVREFIRQNKSYAVNSTHRDFYLGWNDAITHCNESVKEYFGIEE